MIIVSQNKKVMVNFDNVERIKINEYNNEFCVICDFLYGSYEDLGEYATKERAKEVLAEIVQKYSSYLQLNGGSAILQGQMDIQPNIFNIPKVYEMPEE